jgi:hypothetical protein
MLITRRLFCFEASLSESHLRRSFAMVKIEFCRIPAGHSTFLCFISCTIYQWFQFKSVRLIYTLGFNAVTVVNSGNTRMPVTASAQKKRKCATTERRVWSSTLFQPAFLIPIIPFSLYVGCRERLCKCVKPPVSLRPLYSAINLQGEPLGLKRELASINNNTFYQDQH